MRNKPINKFRLHYSTETLVKVNPFNKTVAPISCSPDYKITPSTAHDGHFPLNLSIISVLSFQSWPLFSVFQIKTFHSNQFMHLKNESQYIGVDNKALMYVNLNIWEMSMAFTSLLVITSLLMEYGHFISKTPLEFPSGMDSSYTHPSLVAPKNAIDGYKVRPESSTLILVMALWRTK